MKNYLAILLTAVILLSACTEVEPAVEPEQSAEMTTAAATVTEVTTVTTDLQTTTTEPLPVLTDEQVLTEFVQRLCDVRGGFPYFTDINKIDLWTIVMQYCVTIGWDWEDTSVFSDGDEQHQYEYDGLGAKLGVSPARLDKFMKEYYNLNFSIESYDYKKDDDFDDYDLERQEWDEERGLIVSSIYGGSPHWVIDAYVTEIREEDGEFHVYALKVGADEGVFVASVDYIHCVFTKNANGNFNIMSKRLIPESEHPEKVAELIEQLYDEEYEGEYYE